MAAVKSHYYAEAIVAKYARWWLCSCFAATKHEVGVVVLPSQSMRHFKPPKFSRLTFLLEPCVLYCSFCKKLQGYNAEHFKWGSRNLLKHFLWKVAWCQRLSCATYFESASKLCQNQQLICEYFTVFILLLTKNIFYGPLCIPPDRHVRHKRQVAFIINWRLVCLV